jgi:predicted metal-dependent enzyme (double-stranded beta helix superfamily)
MAIEGALSRIMGDEEFVAVMERAAALFPRYRDALARIPYAYSRTRVVLTPRCEVIAMHWAPGSVSPIHDHGPSRCWVLMIEGSLEVENFEHDAAGELDEGSVVDLRATHRMTLKPSDIDHRVRPNELHRVRNAGDDTAYSLQVYAAPLSVYCVFDEHTGKSRRVTSTCDLELDLETL